MIKNITLGQYFPGESPIHKIDPRTKILLALALIVFVFIVKTYIGYAVLFVYIFAAILLSGIHVKYILKNLKSLWFILVFTFILNAFFTQGETTLFEWSIFKVTKEGLNQAVFLALRLVLLLFATSLLTLTTSPIEFTDGLEKLLKPLTIVHFPVHELAMMMTIAIRFIPTLLEETDKIISAQTARGADFESKNLIKRAYSLIPLLIPLFVSAFRRANELALAMEARCYAGGKNRTRMKKLKMSYRDFIAYLTFCGLIVFICFGY